MLRQHVRETHADAISSVVAGKFQEKEPLEDRTWDVYNEAIAVREREAFPAVGCSVDRRAFEYTLEVFNDERIRSLICCVCVRAFDWTLEASGRKSSFVQGRGSSSCPTEV